MSILPRLVHDRFAASVARAILGLQDDASATPPAHMVKTFHYAWLERPWEGPYSGLLVLVTEGDKAEQAYMDRLMSASEVQETAWREWCINSSLGRAREVLGMDGERLQYWLRRNYRFCNEQFELTTLYGTLEVMVLGEDWPVRVPELSKRKRRPAGVRNRHLVFSRADLAYAAQNYKVYDFDTDGFELAGTPVAQQ